MKNSYHYRLSYTREWEENSFSKTLHAQHFASFIKLFGFLLATQLVKLKL